MKARQDLNILLYSQKANGTDNDTPKIPNDYISIRLGDVEKVKSQLQQDYIKVIDENRCLSNSTLRNTIYHFILRADEISRTAISAGMSYDESVALADVYICKADKCTDIAQISELFFDMCIDYTERICEIVTDTVASPHIRKCKAYIYENHNISVKKLAELTGLNQSYLSKLFSKEVGISIKKFITNVKIETAKNLLSYTNLSYIEIAYSLGFSSQSSFIRAFKTETGETPKKYRESNRFNLLLNDQLL